MAVFPAPSLGAGCMIRPALARNCRKMFCSRALTRSASCSRRVNGGDEQGGYTFERKMLVENSWLNYSRNALIATVAGTQTLVSFPGFAGNFAGLSLIGAGGIFVASGTVQYLTHVNSATAGYSSFERCAFSAQAFLPMFLWLGACGLLIKDRDDASLPMHESSTDLSAHRDRSKCN